MNTVRSFSLGFTVHGCWRRNAQNSTSILQWGSCIWLPAPKLGSTAVCQGMSAERAAQCEVFPEQSLSCWGSSHDLCVLYLLVLHENPVLKSFPKEASCKWVTVN